MLLVISKRRRKVVSIRDVTRAAKPPAETAALAFDFWRAGRFGSNGSPEECLKRAAVVSMSHHGMPADQWDDSGLPPEVA